MLLCNKFIETAVSYFNSCYYVPGLLPSNDAALRNPLATCTGSPAVVSDEAGWPAAQCAHVRLLQPVPTGGAVASRHAQVSENYTAILHGSIGVKSGS